MRRREFLKYSAATALAGSVGYRAARADLPAVKVAVIGAKTGPLAPGAAVTHFPPYRLWAHEVNERGGLKLKEGQRKIELIEYDDRTQPPEAIKAVERAATVDKADWIGGLYATGFNLAAAPTFAKYNYPQLTQACVTDQGPALVKKYPGFFMFQSSTSAYAKGAIGVLKKLKDAGQIGNKVAAVNVGDDFGIELANAGRPLFKAAGFEIVYDKSYPLGTQDYTPVIKAAKAANPDAFVAWSYPPDTFGLADAAKIEALSVKAYYCAVGCAFQGFSQKNGPRPRTFSEPVGSPTRPRSATSTSVTRPSPMSTPTIGAARSTTRCSRCSRSRSKRSARWTATPLRPTSGTASSRL
jgi:branched-chain amino acid transport system substrate-binding protein